jgi:hypothetical protein
MMKWMFCVAGLFAISINAAIGQSSRLTPETAALNKLIYGRITSDPGWRASVANALHRYCESLLVQVPRNTPQEDQWVDSEFKDTLLTPPALDTEPFDLQQFDEQTRRQDERRMRVTNSAEYARFALRNYFSECSALTKSLMELKQALLAAEALLWVRLVRLFSFDYELWRLADKVGLVSQTDCLRVRQSFWDIKLLGVQTNDRNNLCASGYIGTSITDHAAIPLLEAAR